MTEYRLPAKVATSIVLSLGYEDKVLLEDGQCIHTIRIGVEYITYYHGVGYSHFTRALKTLQRGYCDGSDLDKLVAVAAEQTRQLNQVGPLHFPAQACLFAIRQVRTFGAQCIRHARLT